LVQPPEHREAVLIGQAGIEDHEIGAVLMDRLEDFSAGPTAGQHLAVGFLAKEVLQPVQDEGVGVSQHETHRHGKLPGPLAA
jgi:hypothetical protein